MTKHLTEPQQSILHFLRRHISQQGYPPSEREIARNLGMKWVRQVQHHLKTLEKRGLIRRGKGARAIEVIGPKEEGIPILGQVAAGKPILAEENLLGRLPLSASHTPWKDAFLLKVKGDSMKEAGILEGDFVLVKPQPDADSGKIVVALIGEEATVKRLIKRGESLFLKPENPAYSPIPIGSEEEIKIIGKVVGVFRLFSD